MNVYLLSLAGALLGWISHPVIWIVAGPFRWISLLYGTFSQESGFNPDALNPERLTSLGLGQFQTDTWNLVAPSRVATATSAANTDDPRRSPFWQGYVSACYVQAAIVEDLRWLIIAVPLLGFAAFRALWTGGIGAWDYRTINEAIEASRAEGRAWPSFLKARAITMLIVLPLVGAIVQSRRKLRGL